MILKAVDAVFCKGRGPYSEERVDIRESPVYITASSAVQGGIGVTAAAPRHKLLLGNQIQAPDETHNDEAKV